MWTWAGLRSLKPQGIEFFEFIGIGDEEQVVNLQRISPEVEFAQRGKGG